MKETGRLKRFNEMDALNKFTFLLAGTKEGFGEQYGKALALQDQMDERKRAEDKLLQQEAEKKQKEQALIEFAKGQGIPPEIASLSPQSGIQMYLDKTNPMTKLQLQNQQLQIQSEKAKIAELQNQQQQRSALQQLALQAQGSNQVVPNQGVGPIQPVAPMDAKTIALKAAQITGDPNYALKAMAENRPTPYTDLAKQEADIAAGYIKREDLKQVGNKPTTEQIKLETDLAQDWETRQSTKEFKASQSAYKRVLNSAEVPSAAGDVALVFNFMKTLDPNSTVREGEFATAAAAAGLGDRIITLAAKVDKGERLSPEQRKDFVDVAGRIFKGSQENYNLAAKDYREKASQYGFNPDRIVKLSEIKEEEKTNSLKDGATAVNPNTGERIIYRNGQWQPM